MRVTLVIPVYNEEAQLAASMARVLQAVRTLPDWGWDIVIADNASVDGTSGIARELERQNREIRAVRLRRRGRGGALKDVWISSDAELLAYMDVDLSTDLRHLQRLLAMLKGGEADLVVGSRLIPGAVTRRGWRREVLSRGFNLLARGLTGSRLRDHQCGFKGLTTKAARGLLPHVRNRHWFFDTELLVLAQRLGWRVRELPVEWADDPDSRVRVFSTIWEDLRGLWRMRRRTSVLRGFHLSGRRRRT